MYQGLGGGNVPKVPSNTILTWEICSQCCVILLGYGVCLFIFVCRLLLLLFFFSMP